MGLPFGELEVYRWRRPYKSHHLTGFNTIILRVVQFYNLITGT